MADAPKPQKKYKSSTRKIVSDALAFAEQKRAEGCTKKEAADQLKTMLESSDGGVPARKSGFCIFINTMCDGKTPLYRGEDGKPLFYETRLEAEREIVDDLMTRLQEFLDGDRDFDDATTIEEYVDEVDRQADGSLVDADDNHFI